jgi:pimeloyl-ACP methyl ester carboxylesterase
MGVAEIGGLKLGYHTVGDPTAKRGQRIMYVHPTGSNGRVWLQHMEVIAESHTPVAIDLPGHGESEGCGFRGAADYGKFVVLLAEFLGWDRFVVAGHSLGEAVALTVAVYDPEVVSGLLLVDTGARLRVHPDIMKSARRAAEAGEPILTDRSWSYASSTPQSVVDQVQAISAGIDPRVTYTDWVCDDSFDFSTRLKDIDIPALAVCGEEDKMTPLKYHQFFQQKMPNCELAVIKNAGHWSYMEQPEEFNRVVKGFLDGLPQL